jgi:carbonic anhydrase
MFMILQEVLLANRFFVRDYDHRRARSLHHIPRKQVAVFTCMDTRLVEFLEPALGLRRGDAKIIKNAGNRIRPGCDDVIRSLAAAVYLLEVREVLVVGHYDCGMSTVPRELLIRRMLEHGIPREEIARMDPVEWLGGFIDTEDNVREAVAAIKNHPLIPAAIPVHGLLFDPDTGEVKVVVNGYETGKKGLQKAVTESA